MIHHSILYSVLRSLLLAMLASLSLAVPAYADMQTDSDWNWSGKPNCKHPRNDSAQWIEEDGRRFVRFQLRDGDIGGCPTDNNKQHNAKYDKPYSERAEWTGHLFKNTGKAYHISFDVRFVQGFDQDAMTATFFQIKDCPTSRVPVQAKLGGWQKSSGGRGKFAFNLGTQTSGEEYISKFVDNDPVDNQWHKIEILYGTGRTHSLTVSIDGFPLLAETEFPNLFKCGRPKLHIGIYRAGDKAGNSHSIVDYDHIQIGEVDE
ncbi:MAG: hypothetical protein ABJO57_13050 [Lentilitoribacter sp.]